MLGIVSDAGGQDDQRLVAEVPEGCGLLAGGVGLDVLLDRAAQTGSACDVGPYLVPRPRRKTARFDGGVETGQTEPGPDRGECGDAAQAVVRACDGGGGPAWRCGREVGAVDDHHSGDLAGVAGGVV